MKVRRAAQIVQVEVRILQIEGCARIGQNLSLSGKRKDHRHAGSSIREAFHAGNVNATLGQTLHTKLAEWVASDARRKTDVATQQGNIVSKDCRRTAQGHRKIAGQVFSLGLQHRGKAVQNQIAIEFAQNTYVKARHSLVSFSL